MGKTYHAEPDKANEHGYSSDYTWITVETEVEALMLKEARIRAVKLKETIETACKCYGMNLTIYNGKIGFVDPGSKRIVMLWGAEYKMNEGDEGNGED